jgi:BASS family bile acid:Na+ symporter
VVLLVGTLMQYAFMPAIAFVLAILLGLPEMLLVGMVLVGASPGGTASNVICYLARGDVALSITLTTLSTLLAVVATPLLTLLYAGHQVEVPVVKMLLDIVKIIVVPVGLGLVANHLFGNRLAATKTVFPLLSVGAICVIIGIVVALNHDRLGDIAAVLALAVMLHNLLGLTTAYAVAALLGWDRSIRRTLAIEVGMQNSGLAVFLALKYFAPAAALPGALFSIWHNLTGSLFAAFVRRRAVGG